MTGRIGQVGDRDVSPAATPEASSRMTSGTILAFDFGERFIGIAVGDTQTAMAHPLDMIDAEANAERFARIGKLIEEWRPARLVVGLPLAPDGTEHDLTRRARRFAQQLKGRFGLTVDFADERYTSTAAEETLRDMARARQAGRGGRQNKNDSHALAAQLILQAYLDAPAAGN